MSKMSDLSGAMNDAVIRRLAGEQSYRRGMEYFSHGHVELLEDVDGSVRALVQGSQDYTVELSSDEGVLDYSCDCPHASDAAFCKHCVAAALAWLNREAKPARAKGRGKAKKVTLADAEQILISEDHDALVRRVLDWAKDDGRLRERILQFAARRSGPAAGVEAARQAFKRAVRVHGFVDYREAYSWAHGVDEAIGNIAQLIEDAQAAAAIELCESALKDLDGAMGAIDDSNGHLTTLRERLQDIHFRACEEAWPDPVALAARLFDLELHSELESFLGAAERYAKILGTKGLKEYRRLAEAKWEKVPTRTAKHERSESGQHFRITHIMESLAKASGDTEELVSVMSRDLSSAYSYLQIGEVYREARRYDKALEWVEEGLKAFPDRTDGRLREFAAEEYHRRRRHDDAMKLMWAEFSERPHLGTFQTLEGHARKAKTWPEWRERALAEIRQRIAKAKEKSRGQSQPRWMRQDSGHSQLVEIFLYEGDVEAAWREARDGGCSDGLWLQLADLREKNHPDDAAPIYLKQAEEAIGEVHNGRYEESVGLLVKAAVVMKRLDRGGEFVSNLEALRVKYKIKRNFVKLVEQRRKSLYL